MNIDMHIHTTASDGKSTLDEVAQMAFDGKLTLISVTDHDFLHEVDVLRKAFSAVQSQRCFRNSFMIVLPGVELTCLLSQQEHHVLHFFPKLAFFVGDPENCPIVYRPLMALIRGQSGAAGYPEEILRQVSDMHKQRRLRLEHMAKRYNFSAAHFSGFAGTKTIIEFLGKTQRLHIDGESFKKEYQIGVPVAPMDCVQVLAHPWKYQQRLQLEEGRDSFGTDFHGKTRGVGKRVTIEQLEHVLQCLTQ